MTALFQEGRKACIDVSKTCDPAKVAEFLKAMEDALPILPGSSVSKRWEHLQDTIYNTEMSNFGKSMVQSADWFVAHFDELLRLILKKRKALTAYRSPPSEKTLQVLWAPQSKVQQVAR